MNNLAVITTKFVLENNSPIISVFRDEDGDWQFFGKENNISETDARVVSLNEILNLDKTIEQIITISKGMQAFRESKDKDWKTRVY